MRIAYLALIELDVPNACLIHTREISEQMVALGHSVGLFLPRPLQAITPWQGVSHHWVRWWGFDALRRGCFMVEACLRLVWQHQKTRFDVLYMRELSDTLLIVWLCRLLGLPFVVELNGWLLDEWVMAKASGATLRRAENRQRRLLTSAAGIISSTRGNADNAMRCYGITKKRIAVQELGVNASLFGQVEKGAARKILQLDAGVPIVLFAGSFHPHHDLRTLIFAFAHARGDVADLRLVLVGDGAERQHAEQWVREAGVEASVLFAGIHPYEMMPVWFAACDIFVVPLQAQKIRQQNGSLATKLWEAMAAKAPVIITDLPATASYAVLTDKARIVPPEDAEAMAQAMVAQLRMDKEERDKKLLHVQRYVCQERSWRKEAEQTMTFIARQLAD